MNERVTAVVAAESLLDGSLVLVIHPVDSDTRMAVERTAFTVTVWREDRDVLRMSLRNPATGSMAYLQSGATLIAFARELGIGMEP
ncbi:MAG: hypothetical protein ABR591_02190 [Candidatus Velthaea sp.]